MSGLIIIIAFLFFLSQVFHIETLLLKKILTGDKYSEDEYIKVAKRNIKKLIRDESTRKFIDDIKVFYVDKFGDEKYSGTKGQCHVSLFNILILVKNETQLKQHIIEHELLHAVDHYLGITNKRSFKELVDEMKTIEERKNWIIKKFPGAVRKDIDAFLKETEEEKKYWLSNSELFVTLNNLRLYMFKKNIIKYGEQINRDTLSKLLEQLNKEKNIGGVDFFTALTFIKMDTDHDIKKLNNFYNFLK